MNPLRVLFVIGSLDGGGSERQMVGLLKRLDRARFAPHLFLVHDGGPLRTEVPKDVPVEVFWNHRQAPRLNWPGRIHSQQVRALTEVLRRWRIQCVYDRNFHSTLITAPACLMNRVPRISTAVSDPERDLVSQETRFVSLKRKRLRTAYQTADRVVAVSQGVREALIQDFGVSAERAVTIYSPMDWRRIHLLAQQPPGIDLKDGRFHVVGAGRLLEAKGWLDLLEATRHLVHSRQRSTVQVHVLGEGPLRGRLESEIERLQLADHFHLEGFQANPYTIFRNCQLLVHPSHYEGLPNVLLEAMACDLPVVATDCRWGPREILQDGRFGELVAVGDVDALAAAIEKSLTACESQPSERQVAIEAARSHVENKFDAESSVRRLEELMLEITTSKS